MIGTLLFIALGSFGMALAVWAEGSFRSRRRTIARRVTYIARANPASQLKAPAGQRDLVAKAAEWVVSLFGDPVWPRGLQPVRVVANSLAAGIVIGAALGFLLGLPWWFAVAAGAAMLIGTPFLILHSDQQKQIKTFETMLADTIDMMVRMLRAGMPVTVAVERVGQEAQEPARIVYYEIAQWLQLGLPLPQAMRNVAERIRVKDFDFFAAALAIQSTVGGNLTATLESLASVIRERNLALLKARAVTAQARLTANIILAILPMIMFILQLTQPGYLSPLLDGSHGYQLIGFVVASYITALVTIRRMISRVKVA